MHFQFSSVADFIAMSGHGPYVWAAYTIAFSVLVYLFVAPLVSKKAFLKQQKKLILLQQTK